MKILLTTGYWLRLAVKCIQKRFDPLSECTFSLFLTFILLILLSSCKQSTKKPLVLQENKFQGTYLSKDYYYRDSLGRITDSIPTAWDLILVDSEGNYLLRSRPGKLEIYETIPAIEELLKLVLREDSLLHVEQEKRYMLLRHSMEPKKYNVMKNCHADIYIK